MAERRPFADLPGPVEVVIRPTAPGVPEGLVVATAVQRLGSVTIAGYLPMTAQLLADARLADHGVADLIEMGLDHVFRPWRHPDPNPMPYLIPFRRLARLEARLHSMVARRPWRRG